MSENPDMFVAEDCEPTDPRRRNIPPSSIQVVRDDHLIIQLLKFIFDRNKVLVTIIIANGLINSYLILDLQDKFQVNEFMMTKPYRIEIEDLYLIENRQKQKLVDVFNKYKMKPIEYLYGVGDDGDNINTLIDRLKALQNPPAPPKKKYIPTPSNRKAIAAQAKYKQDLRELKRLREQDDPVNERKLELLLERIEEYENENP